ncbi:MAG: Membrane protein involved in the export of O-antigen and teichoic acid [Verrucomicrobiaceae bacterium]|nr:Membrane protein involved in the export of O-antigen and teichoic acid [Verrucomicrobiaceae bacterium]
MLSYQLVRLLVGFFLGAWVTRVMGPGRNGILSTAASIGAIAYCLVELGMRQLLLRELGRRKRIAPLVAGTVFKLWLGLAVLSCALTAAWNAHSGALPWSVFWATMVPLLLTCLSLHNNWEDASHRAFVSSRNGMAGYLGAAAARVGCMLWLPTVSAIAWTFAAESAITGVLGAWTGHRRGRGWWPKGWDSRIARAFVSRGAVLVLGQAGTLLLLRADTVMIQHMRGNVEAGIYGAAVRLSEVVYLFAPLVLTILLPRLSLLLKKQDEERFRALSQKGCELMVAISLISALCLSIGGPLAVRLLYGGKYEASIPVLMVHCLSVIPYFQAEWRYAVMVSKDRASVTAWLSWLAVVVNVVLNLLWIPKYGALGAAWATLIGYTVSGVAATWLVGDLRWFARAQARAFLAPVFWLAHPLRSFGQLRDLLRRNAEPIS